MTIVVLSVIQKLFDLSLVPIQRITCCIFLISLEVVFHLMVVVILIWIINHLWHLRPSFFNWKNKDQITFWVRINDTSIPGRRTVVSTHDNLCSRQESSSVNGYSLFFEVLENSQMYYFLILNKILVVSMWFIKVVEKIVMILLLQFMKGSSYFPSY